VKRCISSGERLVARGRSCAPGVEMPTHLPLGDFRTNYTRQMLVSALVGESGLLYLYVVRESEVSEQGIRIKGAPNMNGGCITLCTCKGKMRTYLNAPEWPGNWVAGITSELRGNTGHLLAYMMRVEHAFESYTEMCSFLSQDTLHAKSAHIHPNGDVFVPLTDRRLTGAERFDPRHYRPPVRRHAHEHPDDSKRNKGNPRWWRDVDDTIGGKRPAYLFGDDRMSFVWSRPLIRVGNFAQTQGEKRFDTLREFLDACEDIA
jgi:hypothetical protein